MNINVGNDKVKTSLLNAGAPMHKVVANLSVKRY
jgi:hypothetical protein